MNERASDAQARQRAVRASGSVLVQAPAGSGKTTLLVQRYLRLLGTVEAPESILALTFTRRAAQEMRERVLQALHAAAAPECPATMNAQTWQLGGAAQRHMGGLGFDLERHPSRLRIETIDAFNAWLAAQLPISAGAGARLNLTDAPLPLYREAAWRALAHDEPDQFGAAVERVLALDDQRWQSLVTLISEMLPSRDRWLPLLVGRLEAVSALDAEQLRRVRRHLDEDLDLLIARTLTRSHEAIGAQRMGRLGALLHAAAMRLEAAENDLAQWRIDASPLQPATRDLRRWRGAAAVLLTNDGSFRQRLTKNEGFPPQSTDKQAMLDVIAELERDGALPLLVQLRALPAPHYDDAQWGRVREVAQVLVLASAHLEHVFRERGLADFPAVSMAAVRALGTTTTPSDLSLRLDYRLQHVLVDEFQDTSSAQLELVKLLTAGWQRGDGRSAFCVGDPMQSIYGFRQAEVRAFLELAEEGIGDVQFEVERLSSNFRSARPLVEWINRCFSEILPRADDRARGAIAFRPSDSALHSAAPPDAAVSIAAAPTRRGEADGIGALLADITAHHPVWRIAVLVRAKSHAREIAASLRALSIAFRAVDIEPLDQRPVVRDLLTLTGALLHLGDRTAWLALLRGPWVGLDLADLLHLARAAPVLWDALTDEPTLAALSMDGRARCERLRRTLDAAFSLRPQGSFTRWVEQTWLALGGIACATGAHDLEHVARALSRLAELEERGLPDPAELRQAFGDLFVEHQAVAPVEIMTIHKAKGLEFDMVVIPALDRHIPRNRDQLLLAHQFARTGRDGLIMAARPAVGAEPEPLFEFLRYQMRDAAGLEAERLLYVACTRAKWRLHLTATIARAEPGEGAPAAAARAASRPYVGSLLAVLWPVVGAQFEQAARDAGGAAAETNFAAREGTFYRVPSGWSCDTQEVLFGERADAPAAASRPDTPVFDWAGETARRVGSLVHAELQSMDLERSDEATVTAKDAHFRRWLALQGVPAERLEAASGRVQAALIAVQRDPRARWILAAGYREDLREHALSGRLQGQVVRVVFDRSFIDEGGVRWVIDYKTSEHAGGGLEEFLDREVERYRAQLQRYAALARCLGPEPVRVGLYFPLMRAWREWSP